MKTKLTLSLISITLLFIVFSNTNLIDKKIELLPKAAMNIVKCSSTNFLLNDIDSTKQISPLFENLGSHVFTITTNLKYILTKA